MTAAQKVYDDAITHFPEIDHTIAKCSETKTAARNNRCTQEEPVIRHGSSVPVDDSGLQFAKESPRTILEAEHQE